jgi:bifunctional NMN adenylyltransferase/nudix hydrolase
LKIKGDTAVFVARLQVDELHDGQRQIMNNLAKEYQKVVVVLGVSQILGSTYNPLDYITREKMVKKAYPNFTVIPLSDCKDDHIWSTNLDKKIREVVPLGSIVLHGGRDSFIKHYHGQFPVAEYETSEGKSGTTIRDAIGKTSYDTADFRRGVIYSTQNNYPRIFPTVDILLYRVSEIKGYGWKVEIALGTKNGSTDLYIPGGFVDNTDAGLLAAAKRELKEEVGVDETKNWEFVSSRKVDDWRLKDKDTIITTLFCCQANWGGIKAGDDLTSVNWYDMNTVLKDCKVAKGHIPLIEDFIQFINNKEKAPDVG